MRIIACSSAVSSSDLAETPRAYGRRLAGQQREAIVVDHQQQPIAHHRRPRRGEIERHDRDIFARDVLPDVELGPVRDREDADALALRLAGVVEVPQFGALFLRIPAVRSEEHTSELQSLMRISYAVFCLKKKKRIKRIVIKYDT